MTGVAKKAAQGFTTTGTAVTSPKVTLVACSELRNPSGTEFRAQFAQLAALYPVIARTNHCGEYWPRDDAPIIWARAPEATLARGSKTHAWVQAAHANRSEILVIASHPGCGHFARFVGTRRRPADEATMRGQRAQTFAYGFRGLRHQLDCLQASLDQARLDCGDQPLTAEAILVASGAVEPCTPMFSPLVHRTAPSAALWSRLT